ncbi:hypothetical protein FHS22_002904 [Planomonospora venezuelensis]|uniref:Uncharacterized protein n=1 Tax=Planomonospora venezuelensis TaxID=1999 RepID=A0A841D549_PLAVE|nr:hypothetical protein [Planomonospora venezuelensis]
MGNPRSPGPRPDAPAVADVPGGDNAGGAGGTTADTPLPTP